MEFSFDRTLMDRYIAVAGKVGRLATGLTPRRNFVTSYELPKDGSVMNSGPVAQLRPILISPRESSRWLTLA